MKKFALSGEAGFTLVEVIVVSSITVLITGFLVVNFSRSRTDLNQEAIAVADAIREAQSLTLSGSLVQGKYRCGYGIHFTATGYTIYAGPDATTLDCSVQNRNFDGGDATIRVGVLSNNVLEIATPLPPDIFFEPPDPITYIGGLKTPGLSTNVKIQRKGTTCTVSGFDCRIINVSTSGRIQPQ